jgi:hypothetical protein
MTMSQTDATTPSDVPDVRVRIEKATPAVQSVVDRFNTAATAARYGGRVLAIVQVRPSGHRNVHLKMRYPNGTMQDLSVGLVADVTVDVARKAVAHLLLNARDHTGQSSPEKVSFTY